jgi:hypothetical protein
MACLGSLIMNIHSFLEHVVLFALHIFCFCYSFLNFCFAYALHKFCVLFLVFFFFKKK